MVSVLGDVPNLNPLLLRLNGVPDDSAVVAETGVLAVVKLNEAAFGEVGIPNRKPVFGGVSSAAKIQKNQIIQHQITFDTFWFFYRIKQQLAYASYLQPKHQM